MNKIVQTGIDFAVKILRDVLDDVDLLECEDASKARVKVLIRLYIKKLEKIDE